MWSGEKHSIIPDAFKFQIDRFAHQFAGFQQHDAQELLASLLNGLDEDQQKKNRSIIVDLFYCQLRSTLVCPECYTCSTTYDPASCISIPLPVKKRAIYIYLCRLCPNRKTVRYLLMVPSQGFVRDLAEALSEEAIIPADHLIFADVHQHEFHKIFTTDSKMSEICESDVIYA